MSGSKSIKRLTIINIAVSLLGICYSLMQASMYGVSREIEVFYAASTLVYVVMSLSQTGQLGEIFLPEYLTIKINQGPSEAYKAFCVLINWVIVFLCVLLFVLYVLSPLVVKVLVPGFAESDQNKVIAIFIALIPYFFIEIIIVLFQMFLNAEKRYGMPELLTMVSVFSSIVSLYFFFDYVGIWAIVISMYIGKTTLLFTYMYLLKKSGFQYSFSFQSSFFSGKVFFKKGISTLVYTGSTQFYTVVLTSGMSFLPVGYYAIYKYIEQLFSRVSNVFLRPITIVFFTEFSSLKEKDPPLVRDYIMNSVKYGFLIGFTAITLSWVAGEDFIRFLFWKKINVTDMNISYNMLMVFSYTMMFIVTAGIYRKMLITLGYAHRYYLSSAFLMIVFGIVSYLWFFYAKEAGFYWVVFFNRIVFLSFPIALVYYLDKRYAIAYRSLLIYGFKLVLSLGLSGLLVYGLRLYAGQYLTLVFDQRYLVALYLSLICGVFFIVLIFFLYIFKMKDVLKHLPLLNKLIRVK